MFESHKCVKIKASCTTSLYCGVSDCTLNEFYVNAGKYAAKFTVVLEKLMPRKKNFKNKIRTADNPVEVNQILHVINQLSVSVHEFHDRDDLLWFVAKEVVARLGFEDCVIYLLDPSEKILVQKAAIGKKNPRRREILSILRIPLGSGITGSVAQSMVPVIIGRLSDDPRYISDVEVAQSEICVPLVVNGKPVGVIDCEDPRPEHFTDEHLENLQTIAAILASRLTFLAEIERVESLTKQLTQKNDLLENQILKLKKTELSLEESVSRLRDFVEVTNDWTWEQDAELRFTSINAYKTIPFLNGDNEALGRTRWEVFGIDLEKEEHWRNHVEDLEARRRFDDFRYEFTAKDGVIHVFSVSGVPFYDETGAFSGYRGTVTDITDLVKTRTANEQFLRAIDHVSEGFALWGPDEKLLMHNDRLREMSGLSGQSLYLGLSFEQWIRNRLKAGEIPEVLTDVDDWIAERMHIFRNPSGPFEVARKGRWYQLQYVKLSDGSTVQTITDIHDLKLGEQRFELATAVAGIGVWEYVHNQSWSAWSDSLYTLLGLTPGEVEPTFESFLATVHPECRDLLSKTVEAASKGSKEFDLECRFLRAGKTAVWMRMTGKAFKVGGVSRWFGTLIDINKQKLLDQHKNEFISNINHELRTPLTSIKGSLDLVTSGLLGELPEKALKLLRIGQQNSDRLLLLINDILDLTKIESGRVEFLKDSASASRILTDAHNLNAAYTAGLGVDLEIIDPDDAFFVIADEARTQQILSNLISNAAKFSNKGSRVELFARRDGGFGVFGVRDFGIGIPEGFHSTLFDRFTQVDGSDTRSVGGTGLGLAISKMLAEGQGGYVSFETALDVGSTFSLFLPLAQTADD